MTTVSLRRVTPDDAELIYGWRIEPSIAQFQPLLPLPLADVRAMLVQRSFAAIGPNAIGDFQWIVLSRDTPVGWVSLKIGHADRPHHKGMIGYSIGEAHRNRGYGSGGVAALLPIAFGAKSLDLKRLEAVAAVTNAASRRVLVNAGMREAGRRGAYGELMVLYETYP